MFKRHKALPYLAEDAKAILEPLQPYNDGETPEALGRLDRLWNIDKHRVIHGTTVQLDLSEVKFRPGALLIEDMAGNSPETTWHPLPNPIPDGTAVASVRFRDGRGPPHTTVAITGGATVTLAFGGGFFALPVNGIGGLLAHTARVLSMIEPGQRRGAAAGVEAAQEVGESLLQRFLGVGLVDGVVSGDRQ